MCFQKVSLILFTDEPNYDTFFLLITEILIDIIYDNILRFIFLIFIVL